MNKTTIGLSVFVLLGFFTSCNSTTKQARPKTPEELKIELELSEGNAPLNHLFLKTELTENIVQTAKGGLFKKAKSEQQGWIIKGSILNKATLATFKDAVIDIAFTSTTGTTIESKSFIVYEFLPPGKRVSFEYKIDGPNGDVVQSYATKLSRASIK